MWWLWFDAYAHGMSPRRRAAVPRHRSRLPAVVPLGSALAASAFLTLLWLALVRPARRSNRRAVLNWAAGMTLLWALYIDDLAALPRFAPQLPRRRANRCARALPREGCVASRNLGEPQRALFHYFAGLVTVREENAPIDTTATRCSSSTAAATREPPPPDGWQAGVERPAPRRRHRALRALPAEARREIHRRSRHRSHRRRRRQRRRRRSGARSTCRAADPTAATAGAAAASIAVADRNINTLIDYRYARIHRAKHGENGRGADQYGRGADDIVLRMPVGTVITDADTGELIADLAAHGAAGAASRKGGKGGLGNIHFKSSTNRAPRQFTPGEEGEQRRLQLELKVLADVGLLGMPNAGKSTFIRHSAAHPIKTSNDEICKSKQPPMSRCRPASIEWPSKVNCRSQHLLTSFAGCIANSIARRQKACCESTVLAATF